MSSMSRPYSKYRVAVTVDQRIMSEEAIRFTDAAATKVSELILEEDNQALKLRVYVTGGGCSGFQYGFTFDEEMNEDDTCIEKNGTNRYRLYDSYCK